MATATKPITQSSPSDRAPIWPIAIEVFGVSGEFASGKTLLGLTIDPANTRVYDFEGSATPYVSLGFDHVDVSRRLLESFPVERYPNGVSADQRFVWWLNDVRTNCQPGKFSVIMVDPISELELGIVAYVKKNIAKFGLTEGQVQKGGGLFWGVVKDYQKSILDELRGRCQCFFFTAHMRDQFRGGSPTGQREAKGKETLEELATLYLHLDREAPKEGKDKGVVPAEPNATVVKSRLTAIKRTETGMQIVPALPPHFTRCTPERIREYMLAPPDYNKLKKEERLPEKQFTEEEKLRLELQKAEVERDREQAALTRTEMMRQAAYNKPAATLTPPAADKSAEAAANKRDDAAAAALSSPAPLPPERVKIVIDLARELFADNPAGFVEILAEFGVAKASELTTESGPQVLTRLFAIRDAKAAEPATEEAPFDTGTEPAAATTTQATTAPAVDPIQPAAKAEIENLWREYFVDAADFGSWLKSRNLASIPDMTSEQAAETIAALRALLVDKFGTGLRPSQLNRIKSLVERLKLSGEQCLSLYLKPRGVSSFRSLTASQADEVIDDMVGRELGLTKN